MTSEAVRLVGREVQLVARPVGEPKPTDFALVERPVPVPVDGQVLVRNLFLSVDPYMRGRMRDVPSYVPPYQVGAVMTGGAVGEVIESRAESHASAPAVGDLVVHDLGWREYAVADAKAFRRVEPNVPPSVYLGVLGMPGLTAYVGVTEIAALRAGEVFFVSGAAGAVGSLAGQIAKLRGASRVIGSAGSADKVRYVRDELGFDAAFNYRDGPVAEQLDAAAPDGIDVYFDNVGGDHLQAAIGAMKLRGRVAMCGSISGYNKESGAPGPKNLGLAVGRRLTLRGFLVFDHYDLQPRFLDEVGGWVREGRLRYRETVVDGIEHAADAFIGMLRGENVGKMLVRVG